MVITRYDLSRSELAELLEAWLHARTQLSVRLIESRGLVDGDTSGAKRG